MAKQTPKDRRYHTKLEELIEKRKNNEITQDQYDAMHSALVQEIYGDKTN